MNKVPPVVPPAASMTKHAAIVCPVCGESQHVRVLCKVEGFDIQACATCGTEHATPMPSANELKAYYDRADWFEGGERGGYQNYDAQTEWSLETVRGILEGFPPGETRSVLDVGCGYGTHLTMAAERGWKCFGVELSEHARGVAKNRLGGAAYIVETVTELIPHEFDLVLILDTLEHLPSPYALLYDLFSIGAITPKTRVAISTPNAGSAEAIRDPGAWAYRHPPSHLVYYTAQSLQFLLKRLHFTQIDVRGLSPTAAAQGVDDFAQHAGLLVTAQGSDFTEFMRERYVPGTWSKIAEYEHVPRYVMARDLVAGKTVLDFGCGTGYGAAMLTQTAKSVTGLDIDQAAIAWAKSTHRKDTLTFLCLGDLGASLSASSFDVVTCFEMIEHVDHDMQKAVIASFARLLRDDGVMLISTPNPETTKLYGANPYHIREMNEAELRALLAPHFLSIHILRQYVRSGVMFDQPDVQTLKPLPGEGPGHDEPLAFIAVCAKGKAMPTVPPQIMFDREVDYIADFMKRQSVLNKARLDAYLQTEISYNYKQQAVTLGRERDEAFKHRDAAEHEKNLAVHDKHVALNEKNQALHARNLAEADKAAAIQEREVARHERNIALIEKGKAEDEREHVRLAFHHLTLQRQTELASLKFLGRQLWSVIKQRLQQKWSRIRGRFVLPISFDPRPQIAETQKAITNLLALPPAQVASQPPFKCSLVIPTKNGGELFKTVVAGLQRQTIWPQVEFIVVDSGSSDDTLAVAQAAGAKCISIPPSEFNHGATRDYAIGHAQSERIVLLVQDAVPSDQYVLEQLVAALDDDEAAGAYARQIPQPDADPITRRNLNSWLTGRTEREVRKLGSAAEYDTFVPMQKYLFCNFDNVCSIIRKSAWLNNRFGRINFGEDIDWAERVLKQGHKIVYEPASAVIHSHDRPLAYEYKRTYVCHRKLYAQFGLHQVPSLRRIVGAWLTLTMADLLYVLRTQEPWGVRLRMLCKLPVLNVLQVLGQYLGAKDEIAGRQNKVKGV